MNDHFEDLYGLDLSDPAAPDDPGAELHAWGHPAPLRTIPDPTRPGDTFADAVRRWPAITFTAPTPSPELLELLGLAPTKEDPA